MGIPGLYESFAILDQERPQRLICARKPWDWARLTGQPKTSRRCRVFDVDAAGSQPSSHKRRTGSQIPAMRSAWLPQNDFGRRAPSTFLPQMPRRLKSSWRRPTCLSGPHRHGASHGHVDDRIPARIGMRSSSAASRGSGTPADSTEQEHVARSGDRDRYGRLVVNNTSCKRCTRRQRSKSDHDGCRVSATW
jgi:hypothetical protein